jgi:basic membrane protein A
MNIRRQLFALVFLVLAITIGACGSSDDDDARSGAGAGAKPITVGFIYLGPAGDAGWTYQHDLGRKYVEEHVPSAKTVALESVAEANVTPAIQQLIAKGAKIIFATSFGYGPGVIQEAKKNPDVLFEHATGFERAPNVSTYFAKHWEASYLLGMIAASETKSDQLGYVGSFPIGEVIGDVNAYALGAQSVNPNAKVKVVLINSWFDPPKEKQAANSLIDAGAKSLFGIEDSPSVLQAAGKAGLTASTSYSDMKRFAPEAFLSADVFNWGPYYAKRVKAAQDGTWKSEDFWGSLEDGTQELAPYGSAVSEKTRKLVDEKLEGFKDGSFNPFVGEIRDQSGKVRVPEGKEMTRDEIVHWDWYVQGVEGELK